MDQPSLERELTVDVPEHKLLLSFVNDDDAVKFATWCHDKGFDAFAKWCRTHDRYGDAK